MNGLKKTTSGFFIGTCISRRPRKKLLHKKAKAVDWEASQLSSLSEHQRASQDSSHKIKPYEFIAPLPKQVELSETMIKTDFLPYKAKNKTAKANTNVKNGI